MALAAAAASTMASAPAAADARTAAPRLSKITCVPKSSAACRSGVRVEVGRRLQLRGRGLYSKMRVAFRWRTGALAVRLQHGRAGYTARVPEGTKAGRISLSVVGRGSRRSNVKRITVTPQSGLPRRPERVAPGELPDVFRGDGMWIWQVPKTEGGNVARIVARAKATGMGTVFVKSSDGASAWGQFTPPLVGALKAGGLKVCAWQFVYGADPIGEARAGQAAIAKGADCLVIDAEGRYDGRYGAAQRYLASLRSAIGPDYPVGLTSFPYVDYHPRFPYSVFLGPGGAQANLPQVYWKDIGARVDAASARTFAHNRIYATPLAPLGQAYNGPPGADLQRFRAVWAGYGASGLSWWSWQSATAATFATLARPAPAPAALPDPGWPVLEKGSKGDEVVRMQQLLAAASPGTRIDGSFGPDTKAALGAFQGSKGLPPTGSTDPATWRTLLELTPAAVDWTTRAAPK